MRFGTDARCPVWADASESRVLQTAPNSPMYAMGSVVEHLCRRLGLPMPLLRSDDSDEINAGVAGSGPHDAILVFSGGALLKLTPAEVAAVAAHELAHIYAGDFEEHMAPQVLRPSPGLPGVRWLTDRAKLVTWAMRKRRREYAADRLAAELIGPGALISALCKTAGDYQRPRWPWLATHPDPRRRIRALEKLGRKQRRSHVGHGEPIRRRRVF